MGEKMTNRENFIIAQTHRYEGFLEFSLCPYFDRKGAKGAGGGGLPEYFSFPCMVEDIRLPGHDVEQYRKFYQRPLFADGADIGYLGRRP